MKKRTGRPKLYRNAKLYVRIKKDNNDYLMDICRQSNMTKTEWVDLHLGFLKDTMKSKRASELVQKT